MFEIFWEANPSTFTLFKEELQQEKNLILYERALKMLENDMYITGIGQAVLELLSFKLGLRKQPGPDEGRISCPKFFFIFAFYQILVNFYDL